MKYLLDTNICIYYMKGLFDLDKKIDEIGIDLCFISEITLAELKFGVANSKHKERNAVALNNFIKGMAIVPIFNALDLYAEEKARLRSEGTTVDDFDLLIGASAIVNKMVLVTNNAKHFKNITRIKLENWT